ncbi:MAG TPA: hypothetical protein VMR49_02415 [Candidatus Paceibacterota bacterium]|nr:hypothetical protein [Candidatus Paceibacterota bacterium]
MENNPKKSKALIITIIAVILLGIAVYFLFKNKNQIFGTTSSPTGIGKVFAPLLGTSKPKNPNVIGNGGATNGTGAGTGNNGGLITGGTGTGVGTGNNGGLITGGTGSGPINVGPANNTSGGFGSNGEYSPALTPIPTPNNNLNNNNNSNPNAPVVTFTANPSSLSSTGGSSVLTWTVANMQYSPASCVASGGSGWTGSKYFAGTQKMSVTSTTDYTLTCSNSFGSNSATTTITVGSTNNLNPNAPVVTFTANPSSLSSTGGSSVLTWTVANMQYSPASCVASGGSGWTGSKYYGGTQKMSVTSTTDYTLTCSNSFGSNSATTTITVGETTPPTEITASCPDDPLLFTRTEHQKLVLLLKQFYLIAPTLKTDDDVTAVNSDMDKNKAIIDQATEFEKECQAEKGNPDYKTDPDYNPNYTGPTSIKCNPYYQEGTCANDNFDGSYLPSSLTTPSPTSEWFAATYMDPTKTQTYDKSAKPEDYSKFEKMFYIW